MHVAVRLTLDLVLKHAVGLGQLANDGEDLAAGSDLAELGPKGNLLTENRTCRLAYSLPRGALAGAAPSPRPSVTAQ
jgi:hypothetical protein